MEFNYTEFEQKWQKYWEENNTYKVENNTDRPKYYVLDMFPYPSGSGLHVGHPLGYIASDIYSRYKRLKGFNVLHPMGFDAFGLPAEQYAIKQGKHPARTTEENIATYKKQLRSLGMSYDWSREVKTCDPSYYKWTQWAFLQMFDSWYNQNTNQAEKLETLVAKFEANGTEGVNAAETEALNFTAEEWQAMDETAQQKVLMNYRLAYLDYSEVWFCPALGTVLANDEVKDGKSERGDHDVEKRRLRQWFLRVTAYAERLLGGLETVDWSESMREMQRNWIGKSHGASMFFEIDGHNGKTFEIFTTRPDTIFGVTFMVLAPEHELVQEITSDSQKQAIEEYLEYVNKRSERERMSEVKVVTGAFTGAYAIHPFTKAKIPIWISEYVLASYGTGAIMAVPSDDDRDNAFADKFGIPIVDIIDKSDYPGATRDDKIGKMINSDFINGLEVKDAIKVICDKVEEMKVGKAKINYRLRDAGFSRQRYWGEPFPIVYKDDSEEGVPYAIDINELPLILPEMEDFRPQKDGQPPLAKAEHWRNLTNGTFRETDTMPGYAGSSWYFLRYMDPHNEDAFVSQEALDYWESVDFYIGGAEHAVGHLIYSRMWHKFFKDMSLVKTEEPYKKLVNQGMIQGQSLFISFCEDAKKLDRDGDVVAEINDFNKFVSHQIDGGNEVKIDKDTYVLGKCKEHRVPIHYADVHGRLYKDQFTKYINEYKEMTHVDPEKNVWWKVDGNGEEYILLRPEVEKMSKSKYNVVNPDDMVAQYGADVFRMFEMFLGPIEQSKPWDTKGISGVSKFIRKYWNLSHKNEAFNVSDDEPTKEELKILHQTIKKVEDDIERLSFNTCVSAFMVCVNELNSKKCNKRSILEPLTVLMAPFAPYTTEEIWHKLGKEGSIHQATYPVLNEEYIKEDAFEYPIMIKGKMRAKIEMSLDWDEAAVKDKVLADERVQKWINGDEVKRFILVKGRIVNIVI